MNHQMKSLEDSLRYFGLSLRLQVLEKSLVEVRHRKKTKEEHQHLWKEIDKEMQKLSLKNHPDKVKCRGCSEEEIAEAQKIQGILNKTRTVLKILTATFLENINIDHKYEFYTILSLSSLGTENEIRNIICEVLPKIDMVSEIKQKYIVPEVRSFLVCSRCCITEYFKSNAKDFEINRDSALFHLKSCIKGYEKLCLEIEELELDCNYDKPDAIGSIIHKMRNNYKRDLAVLNELQKAAYKSLKNYRFFNPEEIMDSYSVLPFVTYINVILMCTVMMKNRSFLFRWKSYDPLALRHNDELYFLMPAFYLVSYYSGSGCREAAMLIVKENRATVSTDVKENPVNESEIKDTFYFILKEIRDKMEDMFKIDNYFKSNRVTMESIFKVDNYNEGTGESILEEEAMKCTAMIHKYDKINRALSQDIEKLTMKCEEAKKKLEECDKILMRADEMSKTAAEKLEINKKVDENFSDKYFDTKKPPTCSTDTNITSVFDECQSNEMFFAVYSLTFLLLGVLFLYFLNYCLN